MRAFHILLLLFLAVPLVEIYILIQVGGVIGAFPTVLAVVGTAVLGAFLLRWQGLTTWLRVQQSAARGQLPAVEMLEGVALLFGGALLLTPGFVTDAIGFACLIPPLRRSIIRAFLRHGTFTVTAGVPPGSQGPQGPRGPGAGRSGGDGHRPNTLEGHYHREDD